MLFMLVVWMKDMWGAQSLPHIPMFPGLFSFPVILLPGLVLVLFTMYMWWREVIKEAHGGDHTPVVQVGLRYGMLLFIASEIMFFAAFFWAFFDYSMFPREQSGGVWPPTLPVPVVPLNPLDLPLYNTLLLLLSGTTVTWAHHALRENDRKNFMIALALTVFIGIVFTACQIVEYYEAPFKMADGVYGTTFYLATGFHGFHVIVGTIFLAVCLWRGAKGHFTPNQHFGFEAAAWYWHLDVAL